MSIAKLTETKVLAENLDCEQAIHRHSLPLRKLTPRKKKFTCRGLKIHQGSKELLTV